MAIEVRSLRADEVEQLAEASAYEWGGSPGDYGGAVDRWLDRERDSVVAVDDGRIVAHALIYELAAWRDGRPVAVGGLNNVVTVPERRREGLGRRVLQRALAAMREELRTPLSLLYPTVVPFYRRLGWMTAQRALVVTAAPGAFRPAPAPRPEPAGHVERRRATPADIDVLEPLYERFAAPRSCYLRRPRWLWEEFVLQGEAREARWLALWRDDAGAVGGYAVYELRRAGGDATLQVRDLCATSAPAYRALFGFLAGHNTMRRVRLEVGPDLPYAELVADPASLWASVEAPIQFMARIVDVPGALAGPVRDPDRAPRVPVTLRVVDPVAPWNDRAWTVVAEGDRWACRPAAGEADATVDIATLSALFVGAISVADATALGGLEVGDGRAVPVLDSLCRTAFPPHCADRF